MSFSAASRLKTTALGTRVRPEEPAGAEMPAVRTSMGLWIPIIWYALETSQSVGRWLAIMGHKQVSATIDYAEGSPLDRAVYTGLMILALIVLAKREIKWGELFNRNKALTVLFLFMLVSIVWSDFPAVSFKRWVRALVDVLMALVVLTEPDPVGAESTVIRRALYFNVPMSIIFIKFFRTIGTAWDEFGNEMWVGDTPHKNVLGQVVMVGAIYLVFDLVRNWRTRKPTTKVFYFGYLVMTLWLLRGSPTSHSNTSIASFFIGMVLLFTLRSLRAKAAQLKGYLIGAVVVASFGFLVFQVIQATTHESLVNAAIGATGRDATLTGRTDLWTDLLVIAKDNPVLGVGYGAFWIGDTHNLWEKYLWKPTQGHNGYLDVYVELGAIGVILLIGVIIAGYSGIMNRLTTNFDQAALHFIWLTIIVLHNMSESSYLRGSVDIWFIFLIAVIDVPGRPQETAEPAPSPSREPTRRLSALKGFGAGSVSGGVRQPIRQPLRMQAT
jgi:O-antigen ligase